jgi:hypothetical protein
MNKGKFFDAANVLLNATLSLRLKTKDELGQAEDLLCRKED